MPMRDDIRRCVCAVCARGEWVRVRAHVMCMVRERKMGVVNEWIW